MAQLETTQRAGAGADGDPRAGQAGLVLQRVWPCGPAGFLRLGARVRLGRDPSCEIVSDSPLASRLHAEILRDGPIHLARDLGSTNGLFLNGARAAQGPLVEGSVLHFADQVWLAQPAASVSFEGELLAPSELVPGVIGSALLAARLSPLRKAARSNLPMVIEGATGTGKEGAARAVHALSGRKGRFVAVNCAAVPEQLAEAEFFGHCKGAFTGAEHARPGLLRDADGGTLFLDEVLELPARIAPKLLRALELGEVVPVGESRPIRTDVRIVVASQGSLRQAALAGRFRADLFARLDGVTVVLPRLAERRGDIGALFARFVEEAAGSAARAPAIDADLIEQLCLHSWPHNVRELRATALRLVALCSDKDLLCADDWRATLAAAEGAPPPQSTTPEARDLVDLPSLMASLKQHGGNLSRAAQALGLSRQRAYRMLQSGGIALDALRGQDENPDEPAR